MAPVLSNCDKTGAFGLQSDRIRNWFKSSWQENQNTLQNNCNYISIKVFSCQCWILVIL